MKFDPATAGRCNDSGECSLAGGQGNWNIEALGHDTFDFGDDMNHAHVQLRGIPLPWNAGITYGIFGR